MDDTIARFSQAAAVWLASVACAFLAPPASAQLQTAGIIRGIVRDPSGAVIPKALVTLEASAPTEQRTALTDQTGQFLFSAVPAGTYELTVMASGFITSTAQNVAPAPSENPPPISVVLQVAAASTQVTVTPPAHERAAAQVKAEVKQRVVGVFPNYFVTYTPDAAPLSAAQKFQLGWKTFFDPVPILFSGMVAGIQQARNSYAGYGQGLEGYSKRFGANYADRVDGILIGHVVMQSVLHQDPRYFYKGDGSIGSRVLYAIGTAFIAKGDNGHWQPAYANALGGIASYEISTLYRPGTSRPGLRLWHTVLLNFAGSAGHNLFEQFVLPKLTTHVPNNAGLPTGSVLRAGTPVTLISTGDLRPKTAAMSVPIRFVLPNDLRADGTVVAKAGAEASGRVTYRPAPDPDEVKIDLERVRLRVGNINVPLRSTLVRGAAGALEYHRLENSGRIVITLYVDQDVPLPPAQ